MFALRFKIFVLTLLVFGLIAAPAMANDSEPLKIWISSAADLHDYENMVKMYQEQVDPNFEAEIYAFGFMDMIIRLNTAMQTGLNPPDIVQIDENLLGAFLGYGQVPFVDLTERAIESGLTENIPPQRMALFSFNDRIYGIPQSLSAAVLYYRADRFEALGINPDDLQTWDDFVEIGLKVREAGGEFMTALDHSYYQILLRQRGGDVVDSDGNLAITSDLSIDTVEWIVGLLEKQIAIVPSRGTLFDGLFMGAEVDSVLTLIGPEWLGLDYLKYMALHMEGEWRAMPLPRWNDDVSDDRRTSSYGGQGLLIYGQSKKVDEAWGFIEFTLADVEGSVQRFVQDNSFPSYIPAWDDPRLLTPDPYFGGQSIGALLLELADELPTQNQHPLQAAFIGVWQDYWPVVTTGHLTGETPEASMRTIQQMIFEMF